MRSLIQPSTRKERKTHGRSAFLCGIFVVVLAVILNNFIGVSLQAQSDPTAAGFAPHDRVMLFTPDAAHWKPAASRQAKQGDEFYFNNRLYRMVAADKAQVVPGIDAGKLLEADIQWDGNSRRPAAGDAVQVLDENLRFAAHSLLKAVEAGVVVRFQGRAYSVKSDRSLVYTGMAFTSATGGLRRIEITKSGLQHVIDRHTVGGAQNAGRSVFNQAEDIETLIRNAQLAMPVLEANGYLKRVFDNGRAIGVDGRSGKGISTYRVITTQSGKLVTAYPAIN